MTAVQTEPSTEIEYEALWMQKFKIWSKMQQSCVAARGPNGVYCAWEGRNCGYNNCPRRVFEEVMIDPDKIQPPKPQPKLKNQLQTLQNETKQQRKQIAELTKRLEVLEKNGN